MAAQPTPRRLMNRWATLRGLTAIITFTVIAILVECLVVLYAMSIGGLDAVALGIDRPVAISISLSFHLVPIAVVVALVSAWTYLTRKLAQKPQEPRKARASVSRAAESKSTLGLSRRINTFFNRIRITRVVVRSAMIVLLVFLAFVLLISFLVYPQLVYRTVQSAYQNNSSLLNFVLSVDSSVQGFAQAVAPVGWIGTNINNGLLAIAPTVQNLGSGLGDSLASLAGLDNAGKYLVFQNAAAWISVVLILLYGERVRKRYRYRKK